MENVVNKIVDWIVHKSCEGICQICALYDEEAQSKAFEDDEEPCAHRKEHGCEACRKGIIKHFEKEL